MRLNSLKVLVTVALAVVLILAFAAGVLAAPPWSDAPNSWWVASYGVTDTQVGTVADGYPDGTFKPGVAVTRGQFAKMAVSGLDVDTADPATPTFKDVARGTTFYVYVEGAYAAHLIGGYSTSTGLYFRPTNNITRQQAFSILGRYLSGLELSLTGSIHGAVSAYGTLDAWYNAEGKFYLNGFSDASSVASEHQATTAYLIYHEITQGSAGKLNPLATLTRSQAAALVLRVKAEAQEIATPPPAPTIVEMQATGADVQVTQTGTAAYVGNDPTPRLIGVTLPGCDLAIYDAPFYGSAYIKLDRSNLSGQFYTDLNDPAKPLEDGTHSFTAKVKNQNGIVSAASALVTYVLDRVAPTGSISAPVVPAGQSDAAVNLNAPTFTVTASDDRSGVKQVVFQYGVGTSPTTWTTISTDTEDDNSSTPAFEATCAWGTRTLADGQYQFRAIVTDKAGNSTTLGPVPVTVDTTPPTVQIASGCLVPQGADGIFYSEDRKPTFGAIGADAPGGSTGTLASGVVRVDFLYAPVSSSAWPDDWGDFTLISSDLGTSGYAAYPPAGIPDGYYVFAARAVDRAGNQSLLLTGPYTPPGKPPYVTAPTREVVIDNAAPVVTIQEPDAGEVWADGEQYVIKWTISDTSPPSTVKIEYTMNASAPAPTWTEIDASAPYTGNPGQYTWTVPDVSEDKTDCKIRVTVIDRTGQALGKTGPTQGHYTAVTSGTFTITASE